LGSTGFALRASKVPIDKFTLDVFFVNIIEFIDKRIQRRYLQLDRLHVPL